MRPLSRNRRIAVICAACASIVASSSTLLTHTGSHISNFAHGAAIGFTLSISVGLLALSTILLRRDRSSACSRNQPPGV